MMRRLKETTIRALAWDLVGKGAMQLFGIVVSVILARLLMPEEFGKAAMVLVIVGMAGGLSDLGFGTALIQRRRVTAIHYDSVYWFNLFAAIVLGAIVFAGAPAVAIFYGDPSLETPVRAVSTLFLLQSFATVPTAILRKRLQYGRIAKASVLAAVASGVVAVLAAVAGWGVWALILQAFVQPLVYATAIRYGSTWKPRRRFSFKALRQLFAYGSKMFMAGMLDTVVMRLDTIVIGKLFSPAILGYFNRAKSLDQLVVNYTAGSLMSVLFPALSQIQRQRERFVSIVHKTYAMLVFVTFLLTGGLYLVSEEVIVLLFGEKWLPAAEYFRILVLSGYGIPLSALLVNVLRSRGKAAAFLRLEIYKKSLFLLNLVVGFAWGVEGYLYGFAIATFAAVWLNILFAAKELDRSVGLFVRPWIVGASVTAVSVFLTQMTAGRADGSMYETLLLKGLCFAAIYVLLHGLLRTETFRITVEELLQWRRGERRK